MRSELYRELRDRKKLKTWDHIVQGAQEGVIGLTIVFALFWFIGKFLVYVFG